ncbi:hypothetical protein LOD99_3061 [Oopsacas minuta]|uniref:DDE-1 domain-containing protein n=1 Tax=Oopsacas minuta TaxID=111878 RepID=A0AAV7JZH3_9METZ|nr:hypothetical protein LOD99_3061 [Oopsacas minuta]
MKPTLIDKSEKPKALKDADMKRIPVHYRAQKSSWMTSQLFTDFLQWLTQKWGRRSKTGKFCCLWIMPGPVANIGMPEVTLEELELQDIEAADAGIVFASAKTITQLVKEAMATVGKGREEDSQKSDFEDEGPTPVPSSAAAAQAIETLLLYATG